MQQPARIGIDCRLGGLQHAGIGRYIVELVSRLVTDDSFHWILFCTDSKQAQEILGTVKLDQVTIRLAPIRHYTLAEQTKLPSIFSKEKLDLLHIPHFNAPVLYRGKYVLTVHDLLWHEQRGTAVTTLPWYSYWLKYLGYRVIARAAITKAVHICAPSQTVADAVGNHYSSVAAKITVTKEGIATTLSKQIPLVKKLPRKSKQLLYVGSLYPHKNVALIIKALSELPEYKLIIVSARSAFRDALAESVKDTRSEKQVQFVDHASDAKLAQLYATSQALVQPSFSEGFGLTGLEAMAFDTPVIASDIPIFREIYDSAALFISPKSATSLVRAVEKLENQKIQKSLLTSSREVRARYNWDNTANITKQIFAAQLSK